MIKIIYILPLLLLSCSKKELKSVVIQNYKSSEINLFEGEYIVHFMEKEDLKLYFHIGNDQINAVKSAYDQEQISNYEDGLLVVDHEPLIMPATDIIYNLEFSDGSKQAITIRTDFRKNPLDKKEYENLKVFIDNINSIITEKKEIQNAPKSDMIYM